MTEVVDKRYRLDQNKAADLIAFGRLAAHVLMKHLNHSQYFNGMIGLRDEFTSEYRDEIGLIPPEKRPRRNWIISDKLLRLEAASRMLGHVLSWQSRDEARDFWGGASKFNGLNIAVTGFPQLGDEAITLCMHVHAGTLNVAPARDAGRISGSLELFNVLAKELFPGQ